MKLLYKLALLGALSGATIASAQPSTSVTGITGVKVHRNMTSLAISAWVLGDSDTSATVRLFYRRNNAAAYDSGMVMVPRRGGKQNQSGTNYWATNYQGRLMNLAPGRRYQFYIEVTEPTNGSFARMTTAEDTASTLSLSKISYGGIQFAPFINIFEELDDPEGGGVDPPQQYFPTGQQVHVRPDGDDGNNGGSRLTAVKTLSQAMYLANTADSVKAIVIWPGHYHGAINLNFGTTSYDPRRFLVGAATVPDSVIICGANPLYEQGFVAENTRFSWAPVGNGIYRAWFPDTLAQNFIINSERLTRKLSPTELHSETLGVNGWYRTNDTLYVRLSNRTTPAGKKFYFGAQPYGVAVATKYWRISNLTFQYTGYDAAPTANGGDISYQGWGVVAGLNGTATGTTIDRCRFIGTGSNPVYAVRGGGATYRCDSLMVVNNYFDSMWTGSYDAGKNRDGEDTTVFLNGSHTIFNYNRLRNMFNGVQPTDNSTLQFAVDSLAASFSEVNYNTFRKITDDAIELDSYQVINRLVAYNDIDSCGRAISIAAATKNGPAFVFYNLITNVDGGLKLGGPTGATSLFYHNTIIGKMPVFNPGGELNNVEAANNLFFGRYTNYVLDIAQGSANAYVKNKFNYNLYDSTSVVGMVYYLSSPMSLAKVRNFHSVFEPNGQYAKANILSLDRKDYRLKFPSNAIDTGRRITGVNTGDRGNRYYVRPDIGRYEFYPAVKLGP